MECPRCGSACEAGAAECPRCGVVIAKFLARNEASLHALDAASPLHAAAIVDPRAEETERTQLGGELVVRSLALPCALLAAWLAVKVAPAAVRMLAMWVHESGHAVAAWVCGYAAWPGPWFTPVGTQRSLLVTALCAGLLGFGAVRAWQRSRWFWVGAAGAGLVAVLFCTFGLREARAEQLMVFGGDGGCFVLGTVLMLTMYARKEHPVRRDALRWGLLAFGALAFMDAYAVWTGGIEHIPLGENENGLSDPSVLTEMYGWSVLQLTGRYVSLARWCFVVLGGAYIAGVAGPVITLMPGRPRSALS